MAHMPRKKLPASKKRDVALKILLTTSEHKAILKAAGGDGQMSAWARSILLAAVEPTK